MGYPAKFGFALWQMLLFWLLKNMLTGEEASQQMEGSSTVISVDLLI